jgi:SAM-dependent methyltransferase
MSVDEIYKSHPYGLKLDLGCGYYKPEGYIGLDNLIGENAQIKNVGNRPDILMDLNRDPLPFNDNTCTEVRSSHFLEHSNLDHIINESYRVLKANGIFFFVVPYANSAEGMFPGHSIFLTERWFYENINFQSKFTIIKEQFDPSAAYRKSLISKVIPFSFARTFLFNACWQMQMTCKPKK